MRIGGVGRNVAEACFRTNGNPIFHSIVGKDFAGNSILNELNVMGLDTKSIHSKSDNQTAAYNAILNKNGEMITAIADMDITEELNETKVGNFNVNFTYFLDFKRNKWNCFNGCKYIKLIIT